MNLNGRLEQKLETRVFRSE